MSDTDRITEDELEAQDAEVLPEREAMSVIAPSADGAFTGGDLPSEPSIPPPRA